MDYDQLIHTVSEIVNNDSIYKKGLSLVYELDEQTHRKLDEHLFFTANPGSDGEDFEHRDDVEVKLGGILVRFVIKEGEIAL